MPSVVVAVRKAVVAGIGELIATMAPGATCTYGWQGGADDKRREQIWTARPRASHAIAGLKAGKANRNERMEFDLSLMVVDPVRPPEDVDDRVMEFAEVIEDYFAENKNGAIFEVPGLNWITVNRFEMENRIAGQGTTGAGTLATWTLEYDARLT